MKSLRLTLHTLSAAVAAAILAGATVDASGTTAQIRSSGTHTSPVRARMSSNARRKALLYVSDSSAGTVFVYSYPGLTPMGAISSFAFPAGLCVDPQTGDFWVTDSTATTVYEFAHGGMEPIRTLQAGGDEYPDACAVNPTNGDLAVANVTFGGDDPGDVLIFKGGTGTPRTYQLRHAFDVDFLGYDNSGNLFVDTSEGAGFRLDELRSGAKKFVHIPWKGPAIASPGGVQYDNGSLAVGDAEKGLIYQSSDGIVTGTTQFTGACTGSRTSHGQFYIDGDRVIVPSLCLSGSTVSIYNYPAGGAAIQSISGFQYAFGAVISR